MVNLVLGGVSSFRVDPGLKVSCFVLKHGVRDHQTVSHAQGQESLAIVSDWCWETQPANGTSPLLCLTAKLCVKA